MNCTKIMVVVLAVLPAIAFGETPSTAPAVTTMPATAPAMARVKVTYLGVAAFGLDSAAAKQINITGGLRVLFVSAQSPAEQAGLKSGDILVKLDDQLLINLQQFTVLVRSFAPGRQVALKIYRGAEAMTLTAKLGQQEILAGAAEIVSGSAGAPTVGGPLFDVTPVPVNPPARKDEPNTYASSCTNGQYALRYFVAGGRQILIVTDAKTGRKVFSGGVDTVQDLAKLPADVKPLLANLQKDRARLQQQTKLPQPKFVPTQVIYGDNVHNMTLRVDNGQKFLLVKDKAGVMVYNGSVETPEQVQALPAEIQAKLKIMDRSLQSIAAAPASRPR